MNSILIITNRDHFVFELKKILIDDYIIYNVNNTEDALSILKKHIEIEVVLLEANIVEKDDFKFLKKVNSAIKQKVIILGIYSEDDNEATLNIMFHNGVEDFICYPFKAIFLKNRIKRILIAEEYKRYNKLAHTEEKSLELLDKLEKERCQHLKELEEIQKKMEIVLEQSKRESLTNLYNRRSFEEKIAELIKNGQDGCIMMVDIDDFKLINDSKGHVIGDKILLELAKFFKELIKDKGFVGRLGGDEFGFFLEGLKNQEEKLVLQEELSKGVNKIGENFNLDPKLTVSIGITCLTKNVKSFIDIYQVVDKLMYSNKISRKK